jgi:hypothetical protein
VLRRIIGPVRDWMTAEWKRLHKEERCMLLLLTNISFGCSKKKRLSWSVHAAPMAERREAYRVLVGKSEGRSPLGKPRNIW